MKIQFAGFRFVRAEEARLKNITAQQLAEQIEKEEQAKHGSRVAIADMLELVDPDKVDIPAVPFAVLTEKHADWFQAKVQYPEAEPELRKAAMRALFLDEFNRGGDNGYTT